VLFFCPKDDTPGCTIEPKEFHDAGRRAKVRRARKKEHGPNGLQYLIEPKSAVELIEFLKQAHHIQNRRTHTPARAGLPETGRAGLVNEHGATFYRSNGPRLLPAAVVWFVSCLNPGLPKPGRIK
jgi:hypothetical protein